MTPETISPRIALIGGGTGSFTLLQELKELTPDISALVNMSDDGGSTGVLRDELGVLPPGDVRQCLVALSNLAVTRDMFNFRFGEEDGMLAGHSLGNIILSGLERQHDFAEAVKIASVMLNITGEVVPITLDNHTLVMRDGDEVIRGEYKIGHREIKEKSPELSLDPAASINPAAEAAIERADLVVIAPGNLYGSLLPSLVVSGVREAIAESAAKKVVISNLVTKPGQTDGWHVVDYVKMFESYLGEGTIDRVIYNNVPPSAELLEKYAADDEFPVGASQERFQEVRATAIGESLVAENVATQGRADHFIRRTLIRHNAQLVGRKIMQIYYE